MLPGADTETCSGIAQRIIEGIAGLNIPGAIKTLDGKVTVSIGIGVVSPTEDARPEFLVNVADQSMCHAKKDGRNCWRT